jgi:hypothetical protein
VNATLDRDNMPAMCCRRVVVGLLVPALLVVATPGARAQSNPDGYPTQPPAGQPPPPTAQPYANPYGAPPAPQPYGAYGAPYAPYGSPYPPPVNPQNWYLYEASKKSVAVSVILELFIPGVGSIYADHVIGAVITWGLTFAGLVVALSAFDEDQYGYPTTYDNDRFTLGLLLVLGGRIYGIVDSVQSANDFNRGLAARLGLPATVAVGVTPLRDGTITAWGPSLAFRF